MASTLFTGYDGTRSQKPGESSEFDDRKLESSPAHNKNGYDVLL